MPLFTNPIVLNDGAADHPFSFVGQLNDKKALVGSWAEPTADVSADSKLVTKQDSSSPTVRRRLFQRRIMKGTLTRGLRPITVNFTVSHDAEHTNAQIEPEIAIIVDGVTEGTFNDNFLAGMI